jgi:hypothetical protein
MKLSQVTYFPEDHSSHTLVRDSQELGQIAWRAFSMRLTFNADQPTPLHGVRVRLPLQKAGDLCVGRYPGFRG